MLSSPNRPTPNIAIDRPTLSTPDQPTLNNLTGLADTAPPRGRNHSNATA